MDFILSEKAAASDLSPKIVTNNKIILLDEKKKLSNSDAADFFNAKLKDNVGSNFSNRKTKKLQRKKSKFELKV